jgi:MATE family multidrug resistance protein
VSLETSQPDTGRASDAPLVHHSPLGEMLMIAAPVVVTMTSYTVMQFVDGFMVSKIGPEPVYLAAQGNGGMMVWLLMSGLLGLTTVINTYVSQHLGAGTPERAPAYAWAGLWIGAAGGLLALPLIFALPWVASLMGHDPTLQRLETGYASILLTGIFFTLGARAIAHYFYGMHVPTIVMVSVLLANVVNIGANYVLIFGHFGFPALGVRGAALGTVIGSSVELAIPVIVFLSAGWNRKYATRSAWRLRWSPIKDILRIGWPGGAMFANEMFCWGYLMAVLLGLGGAAALKAAEPGASDERIAHAAQLSNSVGWIALRYMHVSFMPTVGLSIATTAIVGRCMGMGRPDLAARRAWLGLAIGMAYMGLCAVAFVLFRRPMLSLFIERDTPPEVVEEMLRIGSLVMIGAAVFQVFDAIAIIISGALRGAGDTVWPGVATIVLSWACIIGGGHVLILAAPQLGSIGPWIGASAYIILLGLAVLARFLGGTWRSIELIKHRDVRGLSDGTITLEAEPLAIPADAVAGTTPGSA